ncbi:MAG: NAD(P)/FAD-dependent oxidoreductase [Bacteroidetes bacterium]|nr:NAD(P)/FAD-dependent oxidoreductase [Bacteroidota bacterium]
MKKQRIIILGGGFAGLHLAKKLNNRSFDVILIDKLNHHQFQPLFYQVATARLEPANISFPFRKIFQRSKNIQIRLAEVTGIVANLNTVKTTAGDYTYDHLVIATGCKTNFFGNEEIRKHAYSMKTTQEAITIRNEILLSFEQFIYASEEEKEALLNIVIVGAGPTGVELSGAFSEMKKYILPKDYPNIDFSGLSITLLEGSKNTLNSMSADSQKASREYLEKMGVKIRTETFVINYDGTLVTLNSGETIKSKNVIWAAGVSGNIIEGLTPESIIKNRFVVDRFNKVKNYNNIYAIGDIAYMVTPKYPHGHPQLANVAINQGKNIASNFLAILDQKPLKEYEYKDLGSMATIGTYKAVIDLPALKFKGVLAWFVWMFLHLMLILSVRNKFVTFMNWTWNFLAKDSSLRLIFKNDKPY